MMTGASTHPADTCTYGALLRRGQVLLREAGLEEAGTDAWLLFAFVTGWERAAYLLRERQTVEPGVAERYESALMRRLGHEPVQQIMGYTDFYGYRFRVTKDTLIPRLDTEVLVEEAIRRVGACRGAVRVLDVCTGSGCIALTIKKERREAQVWATDLSEAALQIARENARSLEAEVCFAQGDLLEPVTGAFDLIVSNPPYIPTAVIGTLSREVRLHDPILALDGGEDGLKIYRRLIPQARQHLRPGGALLLEIGHDQAGAVSTCLQENGFFDIQVIKDLAGRDRVVSAGVS